VDVTDVLNDYPKVKALKARPEVAVTINTNTWPYHLLIIRGAATLEQMSMVVPEYALAAERYMGPEQGRAWVQQAAGLYCGGMPKAFWTASKRLMGMPKRQAPRPVDHLLELDARQVV
jgi:hypothetical protein